ncbi:MAG: transcriptional regulator [Acidobacteria bacterium]|nr:MAG: transcriptional regulator [Acidobacteriota bacterium]
MSPSPGPRRPGLDASVPLFAALGDGTRLRLVSRLGRDGPMSITRLTAGGEVTRQAVTKHLHVLAHAGLVRSRRRGRESLWELEPRRLEAARRYLDAISKQWDVALGRLKAAVEGEDCGGRPTS